ncbi:MAG: GPR endopeptidase [Anaerotruncus sp.]|nr:GPR endopeptidase [Anaerotruncus sp.]
MHLIRTDLAVESTEAFRSHLPKGVQVKEYQRNGISITAVEVCSTQAAEQLGRTPGRYVTIELPSLFENVGPADEATQAAAIELRALLPAEGTVLVVGLGNGQITPDALGPRTIRQVLATRHIPEKLAEQSGLAGLRPVAALATGVLGQTGIETGEIVHSVVRDLKPAAVIVVDALASQSLKRLGRTIQLADSGISPGSGVLNTRQPLCKETLGVPVISMGIPTVVDGGTLACELLGGKEEQVSAEARAMMVTPRDIDAMIERGARHLSLAINAALQPQLSMEDIVYLVS